MSSKSSDQYGDSQQVGAETLGQRLRRAREARELTLREISDQTRISRRYLEAIESDDYKQLPGGIFNRSFVKAFARTVGFDEAEAVRLYLRAAGEAADEVPTRQQSRIYTDDAPARSPLITAILSLLILAIISLVVYAGLHYYQRTSDRGSQQQANAGVPTPATNPNNQTARDPSQPAPAASAAPAPQPAGLLSVRVRAKGEDVWLRTSADDDPATAWNGILKPDEVREISAGQSLKLEYARIKAPALEVTINGRPAVVPSETAKGKMLVEMLITKDDYERLLQQP